MRRWIFALVLAACGSHRAEPTAPARGSATQPVNVTPDAAVTSEDSPAPTSSDPRTTTAAVVSERPLPQGARKRLGGTALRHAGALETLAVSADGHWLATGGGDGSFYVWDAATGAQHYASEPESGGWNRLSAIAFVGDAVAFGRGSAGITVLSLGDGNERALATCGKARVEGIAPSPDGKTLAVACEGAKQLFLQPFDGGAAKGVGTFDGKYGAIAWSGDGKYLAAITVRDDKLHLVDMTSRREIAAPKLKQRPHTLAFGPTGAVLAYDDTGDSFHEAVVRYDVAAGKELGRHEVKVAADAITFSRDGSRLAYSQATGKRSVIVIELATGTRHEYVNPTVDIKALAFADAAGSQLWLGHDHGARKWDLASDREVLGPAGHSGAITTLAYRPDGKTLASGSSDGTIRLWNLARGTARTLSVITDEYGVTFVQSDADYLKISMGALAGLAWSRDGRRLYEAETGGMFRAWDPDRGVQLHAKSLQPIALKRLALSRDDKRAFALGVEEGPEDSLRIVDAETSKELARVRDVDSHVLAQSRDGSRLAVFGSDEVRVLDAATGTKVNSFAAVGVQVIAFSPDGKRLAYANGSFATIVDLSGGAKVGEASAGSGIEALEYAPDGRLLMGTYGGDVVIGTGEPNASVTRLSGHRGIVHAIAVAPDGKTFATGGEDGQILIWPL